MNVRKYGIVADEIIPLDVDLRKTRLTDEQRKERIRLQKLAHYRRNIDKIRELSRNRMRIYHGHPDRIELTITNPEDYKTILEQKDLDRLYKMTEQKTILVLKIVPKS